jgi:type IV secretion system protein TrbB
MLHNDPFSPKNGTSSRLSHMLLTALGPVIGTYLQDPKVVELMLNDNGSLWVEKLGEHMFDSGHSIPPADGERIIRIITSSMNRECNKDSPSLAAVLPGCGSRFQGFLPPIVSSPSFAIRKKALQVFTLDHYVEKGILEAAHAATIKSAVLQRKNILIVGGTGTGKTTLANAILAEIAKTGDRIITIEDTPELQCTAPNSLSFHTCPPSYTMQHAIKDALRVRPDRIIVGEVRDGSALDLLKGWNTGHNGGIATLHANGALEGLTRLEQLIGEVSVHIPHALIAQAVHVVIVIERRDGGRKVTRVASVCGIEGGSYRLTEG